MGSKGIAVQALTEVLDHVISLRLTVDEDIKTKLLLDLDIVPDLLLNEAVVLLGGNLALGELVSAETNLLGLGEGANGGGGEQGKVELLLLLTDTSGELVLSLVVLVSDLGLAILDLGVVGAGRGSAGLHGLGIGLKLLTHRSGALSNGLGNDGNLNSLLGGKGEPVSNLGIQLLLAGKSVRGVQERAGSGGNDALLAKLLDGSLNSLNGALQVGLPDVTAVNNTGGENGLGANGANDGLKLLGVSDKVDVKGIDVLGEEIQVVYDITEVGGESNVGDLVSKAGKLLIGGLESSLGLGRQIENEDGLVDLDGFGTSLLKLGEELLVNGQKLLKQVNGVNGLVTVGLAEVEEADRADKDGAGVDTSLLGLLVLDDSLGAVDQLEGLVILESGLHVVVVGVKPLDHLQAGNIDALLLVATAHSEVLVNGVETILGVPLRDSLSRQLSVLTYWWGVMGAGQEDKLTPKSWMWLRT